MKRLLILATLLVTAALAIASCGGDSDGDNSPGELNAIPGNSELVVGSNRFAFALVDAENRRIVQETDEGVHIQLYFGDELKGETDADFTWAIEDVTGFWTANLDFDQAGEWRVEATVTQGGEESTLTIRFPVTETGFAVNIGEEAPASDNLTLSSEPNIKRVTTDPEPDEAFYEMTVAEALEAGKPFVVVFATPAFCQTQFCGPALDNVKEAKQQFADDVNFIHIEPYELTDEGTLVTGGEQNAPVPVAATQDWRLRTEPWIFIVGADGIVQARIENSVSVAELTQVLEAVAG